MLMKLVCTVGTLLKFMLQVKPQTQKTRSSNAPLELDVERARGNALDSFFGPNEALETGLENTRKGKCSTMTT